MTSLRLFSNHVLLEEIAPDQFSSGGIMIPRSVQQDDRTRFRVAAVGPGKFCKKTGERIPLDVEVGDQVLMIGWFSHTTLEDGTNRKIVTDDQILMKWTTMTPTASQ